MAALPTELWAIVIEHDTTTPTLLSVCLVCHALRIEAQQYLYRRVLDLTLRSQTIFLKTIIDSPRLASYVRTFSIRVGLRMSPDYWDSLKSGFQAMVNLTELLFSRYKGEPCAADLLVGVPFQLKTLLWGCLSDDGLLTFLTTQHELKNLITYWGKFDMCLSRTPVPELSDFGGNLAALRLFLPGRRVRHVHLMMFANEDLELSDPLREALSFVSTFQISASSPRPLLKDFGSALRNVEVLKIDGLMSADRLKNQVTLMPRLRRVVLSAGPRDLDHHYLDHDFMQAKYQVALKKWLFENCELLDIVEERNLGLDDDYLKWTRFSPHATASDGFVRGW
ncbi:hypothetical protein BDN72DRAFT_958288 [Pluteus cervinus]|uniref:Uncharacterized protein n=1 Tax=Pluteus cervinus TaxID=181527 RepID=A0ACD3B012_9AGAR|nr:hypothetical protein BDN72DRAFT_958288 [Pluteus cervinus]